MRKDGVAIALLWVWVAAGCGKVANDGGEADAGDPDGPVLSALEPGTGLVGARVTLTGRRFGDEQAGGVVSFGGAEATVIEWSDTSLEVELPDVYPGAVAVTVGNQNGESGAIDFAVVLPPVVYLAVNGDGSNTAVRAFAFSAGDGSLRELDDSPFDSGAADNDAYQCAGTIALHVATRRLYATGYDQLAVFDVDPRTGALTPVAGSPFPFAEQIGFKGIAVNRAGDRLFVSSYGDFRGVTSFAVDGDGVPTRLDGLAYGGTTWGDRLFLSDSEEFLYVNPGEYSLSEGIYALSIAADGTLTEVPGSPFASVLLSNGTGLRPGRDQLASTSDEQSPAAGVHLYSFDGNGSLVEDGESPFEHGLDPFPSPQLAWSPNGERLFLSGFANESSTFQVLEAADDGALSAAVGPRDDLIAMWCMHVSTDGGFLFATPIGSVSLEILELPASGLPTPLRDSPFEFAGAGEPRGVATTF